MTFVLDESQSERDQELSEILSIRKEDIEKLELCNPEYIKIFGGERIPEDIVDLYREYKYLNIIGYYRTLMMTSVERRHPNLIRLLRKTKNKVCLDFGSGVGTHAIALMQNNNRVSLLDVDGPLLDFTIKRINHRFGDKKKNLENIYFHDHDLPDEKFDVIICTDVLEHVPDPVAELRRLHSSLKKNGVMHLEVSSMIKPSSGHFESSIKKWEITGIEELKKKFKKIKPSIYKKRSRNVFKSCFFKR